MPNKLQKAIRAVKDKTSIGLAHISRRSTSLEVTVLKATSHDEMPVADRYLADIILLASSPSTSGAIAAALRRRISRTRNWVVALKCLCVAGATISDSGPDFRPEARAHRILDLSLFSDKSTRSSPWDFTAFVRTFALYLDARLQASLKGHIPPNHRRRNTFTTDMKPILVLERIEHFQRILDRAIGTRPTGPAITNRLVQISLDPVMYETYDLYHNVIRGLTLLLDEFFDLPYSTCIHTFAVCSKAARQFEELDGFYDFCKRAGIRRAREFPNIQKISGQLLRTLEQHLNGQRSGDISLSAKLQSPLKLLLDRSELDQDSMNDREGWEMVLTKSTRKDRLNLDADQETFSPRRSSYNPFLDAWGDKGFVASPFTTHDTKMEEANEEMKITKKIESDPFEKSLIWVQRMDEPARQKLNKEKQMWLQHQNKMIEKSLAW